MTVEELFAFAALCLVLAATPGANLAVVLRCASLGGQRAAVTSTVGLTVGKAFWAAASLAGLAAVLATSAAAYNTVRLLGAAYLMWLGVQAIWTSSHDRQRVEGPRTVLTPWGGFRRGLVGDLLNPKVGLFYTTVFPQFIGPGDPIIRTALTLLVVHALVLLTWYPSVAYGAGRIGRTARWQGLRLWSERAMGVVLVALGVRLAIERR